MTDSHIFLPTSSAFAAAPGVRVSSGLPYGGLPGTAHRLAPSSRMWALRPDGRGISQ